MHHVIYASRATQPFSDNELVDLLLQARRDNAENEITGVLVYANGQFMQLIEGEEEVLHALYERLQRDPRHMQLVKFADKAILERSFNEWSMAFRPVSEIQFAGLTSFISADEFAELLPHLGSSDGLLLHRMKELMSEPV